MAVAVNRYTLLLNDLARASNKIPPCSLPRENPHTVNISPPMRTSLPVHVTDGAKFDTTMEVASAAVCPFISKAAAMAGDVTKR